MSQYCVSKQKKSQKSIHIFHSKIKSNYSDFKKCAKTSSSGTSEDGKIFFKRYFKLSIKNSNLFVSTKYKPKQVID